MKLRIFLLILPLFLTSCGTKKVGILKLREDLSYLEKSIKEIHPAPFAEIDSEEYSQVFERTRNSIKKPLNEHQFYRRVAPIVARLKDGHTETIFPNKTLLRAFFWGAKTSSFDVVIIGSKVYGDYSKEKTSIRGMEILEINGEGINPLLERMISFEEGKQTDFRKKKIESIWEREFFQTMGYSGDSKLKLRDPATGEITLHHVILKQSVNCKEYYPNDKRAIAIYTEVYKGSVENILLNKSNRRGLCGWLGRIWKRITGAFHEDGSSFQHYDATYIGNGGDYVSGALFAGQSSFDKLVE